MPEPLPVPVTVADLAARLDGRLAGALERGAAAVHGGYASDLLSDVMARAHEGDVWVTLQKHVNTVAVAHLKGIPAIVIVNGREPEPDMLARAAEFGVAVILTPRSAFDAAGILYQLGLCGSGTP
jgi:hypothetical protein